MSGRESTPARGSQTSGHGNDYHTELTLLYFLHLHQNPTTFYELKAEDEEGEKFDDLKVVLKEESKEDMLCYLQFKSFTQMRENKRPRKTSRRSNAVAKDKGELLYIQFVCNDENHDSFDLVKYFESYQSIKKKSTKNFMLYLSTNGKIEAVDVKKLKPQKKREKNPKYRGGREELELMKIVTDEKSGKYFEHLNATLFKISHKNFNIIDKKPTEIYLRLKKANSFYSLLNALLYCVINKKACTLERQIFRVYHRTLVKERIIDIGQSKFHRDFIEDKLYGDPKTFRDEFFLMYKKKKRKAGMTDEQVKKALAEISIIIGDKFGDGAQRDNTGLHKYEELAQKLYEEISPFIKASDVENTINLNEKKVGWVSKGVSNLTRLMGYVFVFVKEKNVVMFSDKFFEEDNNFAINDNGFQRDDLTEFKDKFKEYFKDNEFFKLKKLKFEPSMFPLLIEAFEPFPENVDVNNQTIKEFFDNFILAVNQPDGSALFEKIKETLPNTLLSSKFCANDLLWEIRKWILNPNSMPWKREDVDKLFKELILCETQIALDFLRRLDTVLISKKEIFPLVTEMNETIGNLENNDNLVEVPELANFLVNMAIILSNKTVQQNQQQ